MGHHVCSQNQVVLVFWRLRFKSAAIAISYEKNQLFIPDDFAQCVSPMN
jgi:hypothetical protein